MTNLVKILGRKSLFKLVAHVIEKSRKQAHRDERRVSVGRRRGQVAGIGIHECEGILTSKIMHTMMFS